ncbi:cobalt transporter [Pilimelia terevasa]|uniref:Cobalt transporter n=1 Tax=Pilimelia terevasa TaxID=53372 RepID=A0A8J3FL96_9ACTN|nr:CbtA family protein [Pilimelia terevasa]GGK39900.1 cobalt transporter [Pilimelia terevasa]
MQSFIQILLRGLLAGLVGGLLAGSFAYTVGEPWLDRAIAVEEAQAAAAPPEPDGHSHEEALVSRSGQKAGLFLATALFGVAMGGLLATAFALLRRRPRAPGGVRSALGLAAAGLVAVVLVPALKYPPNPPGVGDPGTVTARTVSWLLLVVLGLLAGWAAVAAHRALRTAGEAPRAAAAAGAFLATVGAAYAVLPTFQEVPGGFPATLLWSFRLATLGTQFALWVGVGLVFAVLVERLGRSAAAPTATPVAVGA